MVELIGSILTINPKLVTLKCLYTTVQLPIKQPLLYLALLKLRSRSKRGVLRGVKLVTDDEKGYVVDAQVKVLVDKEREKTEWKSILEAGKQDEG